MKILHLEFDKYPERAINLLKKQVDLDIFSINVNSQTELYDHLSRNNYIAIFVRLGINMDRTCIELQPDLKYIITPTTGLNHIDITLAHKRNIKIISLKGEDEFLNNIKSTAEHTWALLLALIRNIIPAKDSVINGKWIRTLFVAEELDQKTIGIIGYGRLGQIIFKYAEAFGMKVLVNEIDPEKLKGIDKSIVKDINTVLTQSDYVLLHINSTTENTNFMTNEKFSMMKKNAFFINTSRGECVDENALLEALKSKKIKGAALDVLQNDSVWWQDTPVKHPLIEFAKENNNLLITPHIGGYGKDSIRKTRLFITQKFIKDITDETNYYS